MSLKQIIQHKDNAFSKMLASFEAEFDKFSKEAQKQIIALFRQGVYDPEEVQTILSQFGEIADGWAVRQQKVFYFAKQMADEIGFKFAPTEQNLETFRLLRDLNNDKLKGINDLYQHDIINMGIRSRLEGKPLKEIAGELSGLFDTMGRRVNTEAFTGIGITDAAVKKDLFDKAGVELYYYDGPDETDPKIRDACKETMMSEKQSTGWTIEEINASRTPFIVRGGYNCRHEWLPFVE